MKVVTGIEMQLPADKRPGFYAQIVKGIAEAAAGLLDRSGELLFTEQEQADAVAGVLTHYRVPYICGDWAQLGEAWTTDALWSDYGLDARAGGRFVDLRLAAAGALEPATDRAELEQAWLQLLEHQLARLQTPGARQLLIDRQLTELADGIAAAYGCRMRWLL
ncbi:hypothetical protein IDH44_04380 [Paenibacillus sp. IB182496]|uniref:Uncharacterized protein n=1 Tax=Paenibacillus sabuli TaxID=2772509 RepID=A0A927BQI6_9BACL|nr:hypothetical protein [Paenibacillus sabuli]MBD2844417.1 hypothetical protein [Paenibacillus sabuli]